MTRTNHDVTGTARRDIGIHRRWMARERVARRRRQLNLKSDESLSDSSESELEGGHGGYSEPTRTAAGSARPETIKMHRFVSGTR